MRNRNTLGKDSSCSFKKIIMNRISHTTKLFWKKCCRYFTGSEVIEIQTRALYRLKTKTRKIFTALSRNSSISDFYDKWGLLINEETGMK